MTTTISIDAAGRLVIPKKIREKLSLQSGGRLKVAFDGEEVTLSVEEPEVRIGNRAGRRVVTGWDGFDAAKAVGEARAERLDSLRGED